MRIQNVLEEALKLARATIPANIDIKQHIQMGLRFWSMVMPHRCIKIGMNLITNAFHALGDAEGEINVRLKEVTLKNEDAVGPHD